jgi:hypothetical protein
MQPMVFGNNNAIVRSKYEKINIVNNFYSFVCFYILRIDRHPRFNKTAKLIVLFVCLYVFSDVLKRPFKIEKDVVNDEVSIIEEHEKKIEILLLLP